MSFKISLLILAATIGVRQSISILDDKKTSKRDKVITTKSCSDAVKEITQKERQANQKRLAS
jgi:hypothetical protein